MKVLVTGGNGTVGRHVVDRLLLAPEVDKIIVFNNNEYNQYLMKKDYDGIDKIRYFLGDIRSRDRLSMAFRNIDIVIHTAALKQIDTLEMEPLEGIETNVEGSKNVMFAAIERSVKKVLHISTDKAVDPSGLYGATKLVADELFINAHRYCGVTQTKFASIRFGNIWGSRGSVVEYFNKLKKDGVDTFPVTHKDMVRYFIHPDEVAERIYQATQKMNGGEIFVPVMEERKIIDVAKEIHPGCKITYVGLRPGEKIKELLVSEADKLYTKREGNFWITRKPTL